MASSAAQTLYSRDILRLSTQLPHDDRVSAPMGQAHCRSPLCGSEIYAEICWDSDYRITALALRPRACALGQASAALLRGEAIGYNKAKLLEQRDALVDALAGNGLFPDGYTVFEAARAHPARHGAILLPFDAVLSAMASAL